jgi:dihydroorotase
LGNLSEGAIADIAVLNLRQGTFGLVDGAGMVMKAHEKMECELTVKNGKFVYDLNGRASDPWDQPPSPAARQSNKWTSLRMQGFGGNPRPIPQTPEGQARIAAQAQAVAAGGRQRPPRWQPYDTDASGKSTVKANAKLAPAGAAKTATPKVPPPAATWATPPSASWPPAQQPQ